MAAGRYSQIFRSANGDLKPGTAVSVYTAGSSTLATLYRDSASATAQDNPVIADVGTAQVDFYAAPGLYDIKVGGVTVAESVPILADLVNDGGTVASLSVSGALSMTEGSNKRMGTATLVTGAKVVATTAVTANSRIFLTVQSLGTVSAPKAIAVTARTAATSFTITSADATDTSVVAWLIVEPAA